MAKDNLEERLRTHVLRLAGDIGERNVFRPLALEAAASCTNGESLSGMARTFGESTKP